MLVDQGLLDGADVVLQLQQQPAYLLGMHAERIEAITAGVLQEQLPVGLLRAGLDHAPVGVTAGADFRIVEDGQVLVAMIVGQAGVQLVHRRARPFQNLQEDFRIAAEHARQALGRVVALRAVEDVANQLRRDAIGCAAGVSEANENEVN